MELIDKILSTDIHEAIEVYKDELKKLGNELYGIRCGSCGNRLIEIYIKLSKNGHQIIKAKMDRIARLKKNVVLRIGSMGITWTNESVDFTDKKALEVIEKFPAISKQFEVLPKAEIKEKTPMELLKEEATELEIEFAGNISKANLQKLVDEKKAE